MIGPQSIKTKVYVAKLMLQSQSISAGFINKVVRCIGLGLNAQKTDFFFPINKQYLQQQHAVWRPEIFTCEDETGSTRSPAHRGSSCYNRLSIDFFFFFNSTETLLPWIFIPAEAPFIWDLDAVPVLFHHSHRRSAWPQEPWWSEASSLKVETTALSSRGGQFCD